MREANAEERVRRRQVIGCRTGRSCDLNKSVLKYGNQEKNKFFKEISVQHDDTAARWEPPGPHRQVSGEEPHQGSVCSSHSPQSKGPSRPWAGGRPDPIGSPESLWCHCLVTSHTSTRQHRTRTAWAAAVPRVHGRPSMRIPAAGHCLCARQKEKHQLALVYYWHLLRVLICTPAVNPHSRTSPHQLIQISDARSDEGSQRIRPSCTWGVYPLGRLHSFPAVTQVDCARIHTHQ